MACNLYEGYFHHLQKVLGRDEGRRGKQEISGSWRKRREERREAEAERERGEVLVQEEMEERGESEGVGGREK